MGFFDKVKSALTQFIPSDAHNEYEQLLSRTLDDCAPNNNYFWSPVINETKTWINEVKPWPDKKKVDFILYLLPKIHHYVSERTIRSGESKEDKIHYLRSAYIQLLFKTKLFLDEEDVSLIYQAFTKYKSSSWSGFMSWPVNWLINIIEKQSKGEVLTPNLRLLLGEMRESIVKNDQPYHQKEKLKLIEKIDGILFSSEHGDSVKPVKFLGDDPVSDFANARIEALPQPQKPHWYQLLAIAQKASGSRPTTKFVSETNKCIAEIGVDSYTVIIHELFEFIISLKEKEEQHSYSDGNNQSYTYSNFDFISSINLDMIKGLVWTCVHIQNNSNIQVLASLAERSFKKIPGKGPAAASIGNACLYVLYASKGIEGVGQLSRLRLRIKQGSTQNQIDKYLSAAAAEKNVSVSDIEDMAVDDFGLLLGKRTFSFDEYKVDLVITAVGKTTQQWIKPDGSHQKTVPAFVKEKYAAQLKELKEIAKQVDQTLVVQRDRIDRMFRDGRQISIENFNSYYFQHGLMSFLTKSIIWNFHLPDETCQVIYLSNNWINANNQIIDVSNAVTVSLWHPAEASLQTIKEWREFLIFHELQQPLKQAFREIYLLTDAELTTRTYSNRMAAHILKQHQFNSLAKGRGWRYSLMGVYDNGIDNDKASLTLPQYNIRAEFWISEVNADGAYNDTGIWNFVSTDQVRFINSAVNETIDLIHVSVLVFSEVMRDVDLFVGVASIGNDPSWQDSGNMPVMRDYWQAYSFGELSEVAKNRIEILQRLVPRLKIRDVAEIKDKFLVVKGKIRTYKIHIGSTNILMEPNDQYLCIVPDRSAKNHADNVFLPFEGDNGLSIILSKAFLLADDDKIVDTTITSQIHRQ